MQDRRPPIAHLVLPAVAALLALAPAAAAAQERLRFEEIADEALYALTLQRRHDDTEKVRLLFSGGTEASTFRGLAPAPARPFNVFAGFGAGFWSSPTRFLQLRSDLVVPLPFGGQHERGLRASDLEGAHRAHGLLGFGPVQKGQTGADLEFEGSLLHAGPYSTSFLRRDVGPAPFSDGTGRATFWPRLSTNENMALTAPISYSLRHVHFDAPLGAGAFTSQRFSSGFGLRPYDLDVANGWLEFVGVAWEKTSFEVPKLATGRRLDGVERIDLRFLHIDGLVGAPEKDLTINVSAFLGASWLWDRETHQDMSTFTFAFAGAIRGELDKERSDQLSIGLGVARRAGFLADASALTRGWRIETNAGLDLFHHRTGGSLRMAFEQLQLPLEPKTRPEIGFRHALASEWYFAFVPMLQVGLHHASTDRCVTPPGAEGGRWCHQLGFFLRAGGGWSAKKEAPEANTPGEDLPPPPPPPREPLKVPLERPGATIIID